MWVTIGLCTNQNNRCHILQKICKTFFVRNTYLKTLKNIVILRDQETADPSSIIFKRGIQKEISPPDEFLCREGLGMVKSSHPILYNGYWNQI